MMKDNWSLSNQSVYDAIFAIRISCLRNFARYERTAALHPLQSVAMVYKPVTETV